MTQKTQLDFFVEQWWTVPPVEHADLTGKTVVVIGANTGIGFETAKHFARMGPAKLVVACRSESKGKAAVSEIVSSTGCTSCVLFQVDLADFASVARFVERFERECDRLDILVMNAGVVLMEYEETINGWESTLQVNHLGTSLLSLLLLPRLVETGKKFKSNSRLVIVASRVHYWATLPEEVKESSNPIATLSSSRYRDLSSMHHRYEQSKLLNVFFARALQDHLQSITPLTVNAVCPGFCYSGLRRNIQGIIPSIMIFLLETCFAWTAEQGSRQLIYAAIGKRDNEDRMKGVFVSRAAAIEPSDFVRSERGKTMQNYVWKETIDILTKEVPQLKSILQQYLSS